MALERTLCIIKPDSVRARKQGAILQRVLDEGFNVLAMRQLQLTAEMAGQFYAIHRERSFFQELVEFMTSGQVVVVALEAEGAIKKYRDLIGATDPAKAAPGTLRRDFGQSLENNAVHGSDSVENGLRETAFFFPGHDL